MWDLFRQSSSDQNHIPRQGSSQTHLTLERIIDALGSTLLSPLTKIDDPHQNITGVVAYDPYDEQNIPAKAVVLGIGLSNARDITRCLEKMAFGRAGVLIVRGPKELIDHVAIQATDAKISAFNLVSGASWTQLSNLIYSMLVDPQVSRDEETIDGLPSGDLFALSNAISDLLDAPITVEDRNSRVLAFSTRQDEADPARIETILERQVPVSYTRKLADLGFFKKLYSSEGPVTVKLPHDDEVSKTRVAIAVRAGGEILGSIWAALPDEYHPDRAEVFKDVAKITALHMLRIRAGDGFDRRLRADLLSKALEGGDGANYAIEKLGISSSPIAVFAIGVQSAAGVSVEDTVENQRIADAVAVYLAAVRPQACTALLGRTIYGVLPVDSLTLGEGQALNLVRDVVARAGARSLIYAGIGPVVDDSRNLFTAREGARRALRVCTEATDPSSAVLLLSDVYVDSLLIELRDQVASRRDLLGGKTHRMRAYDIENGTDFVPTLDIWLECMGDVTKAAELLHIHANTMRYRLRRISEVFGMDLGDPKTRFAAQLLLRIDPTLRRTSTSK